MSTRTKIIAKVIRKSGNIIIEKKEVFL